MTWEPRAPRFCVHPIRVCCPRKTLVRPGDPHYSVFSSAEAAGSLELCFSKWSSCSQPHLSYPKLELGGLGFPLDRKELYPWYKIKEFGDIFNSNQKYPITTQPEFSRSKKKIRFRDFKSHILTIFSQAIFMSSKENEFSFTFHYMIFFFSPQRKTGCSK